MKNRLAPLLIICLALLFSCDDEDSTNNSNQSRLTFQFNHSWDGTVVNNTDFNVLKFTNQNGETLSIERLRYLISDIQLTTFNGETLNINGYNLVDVTNNVDLLYSPNMFVPNGDYSNISFVFGFTNQDNIDGVYQDLNSALWDVPDMLGGGYHYMQLDGKFVNSSNIEQGYNYHAVRAVDNIGTSPTFPQDTFIKVNLGNISITENAIITIEMNIAEWFKNPNTWDLNQFNQSLMGNSTAQIKMFENGQNVFSLKSVE